MTYTLPVLDMMEFRETRDHLREVTLVLGKLQQAFLPVETHEWQKGLEVTMRGLSTQILGVAGQETRATLDLVRHKVRLDGSKWGLHEYMALEIMNNIRVWLESRGLHVVLQEPEFVRGVRSYDTAQAEAYAEALWWMDEQFRVLKAELKEGLTGPILLYPHHFDLSLSWFPWEDERQVAIGWSTGDDILSDPYVYMTAYPKPENFNMAILPYARLQSADDPARLLRAFSDNNVAAAKKLLGA